MSALRKLVFPLVLLGLAIVFFLFPPFKEVIGGVAILLFGMIMLEKGFNTFVEGPLKHILQKVTDKLYKSLSVGFIATAILQSSSLVSVIAISFVGSGLIGLKSGIGIIFGANLGTTVTAWLVSIFGLKINISVLAMPLLGFGIVFALHSRKTLKGIGNVLAGLGFFFLGIFYMKNGFDIYKESFNLADYAITGTKGLLIFTAIGIVITMILQSSSATIALILTALAAGQVTYFNALALTIGANVGTTITAILGSLGTNASGKRLAAAHFIFKIVAGLIALFFISQISVFIDFISDKVGFAMDGYVLKISLFHTLFNLIGVIVMVPFINILIKFLNKVIKDKTVDEDVEKPKFLNKNVLNHELSAVHALYNESRRLFEEIAFEIIAHGINLHREDVKGNEALEQVIKKSRENIDVNVDELYYKKVKTIYSKIIKYATLTQQKFPLDTINADVITHLKFANRNVVEVIKDIRGFRKNIIKYTTHENETIKKAYNNLREDMSEVLRLINLMKCSKNPKKYHQQLIDVQQRIDKSDVLMNGKLDEMIRTKKITATMATSLANDSRRVVSMVNKLTEAAELLYTEDAFYTLNNEMQ